MNVEFKLSAATSGTTASTAFNISGTTSSNVVSELATGVTKSQLTTGYTINGVNDAITGGTIASISPSTCTGFTATWSVIQPTPTPTPTVTPTPTGIPSYEYAITQNSFSTRLEACSDFTMSLPTQKWAAEQSRNSVTRFFNDENLTDPFVGAGGFYCWRRDTDSDSQRVTGDITASGYITSAIEAC
jgi:hypothetical protein